MQPLGAFCEFKYGKSLPQKRRKGGIVPVYGSNGIVGYHDIPLTKGATIIVGRKGSVGALQYSVKSCCPIDTTYYVDQTCTEVDLRWLFFTLQNLGLETLNKHVAVPGLNRNDAYEKELLVPPLDEQKRIAAVLDKADALRRQRQESLQLTEKLLQSVFIDMFGDPVLNPKGWDTVPLEELCDKIVDCPHNTPAYTDAATGFYCVRSSDIQNGKLDLASTRHVSESVFAQRIVRHEPTTGEVIYTREGGRLGFAAQVPPDKHICLGQRMMLFTAKEKVSTNTFLANLLNSESFRRKVLNLVGGGAAPRVNIKDLRTIVVYRPPFELQQRFDKFTEALLEEEESLAQSEVQTRKLFESLQQRAFRGDLDLSRLNLDTDEPDSVPPVTQVRKPDGRIYYRPGSFIAPEEIEKELFALEEKFDQAPAEPRPWSEDYFKYRTLSQALLPPFSFAQIWEATILDMEEASYETVKDKIFEYLQDGTLRQRFCRKSKEIVFFPRRK